MATVNDLAQTLTVVKGNVICPDCMKQIPNRDVEYTSTASQSASSHSHYSGVGSDCHAALHEPNGFLTFILSCMLPGLGHLYVGLITMGIELMVVFFGTIFLIVELHMPFPFVFVLPIVYFFGIFDALQKRDRIMSGIFIDPQSTFVNEAQWEWAKKKWLGWTVIIVVK